MGDPIKNNIYKELINSSDFDKRIKLMSTPELEELMLYIDSYGDNEQLRDCVSERQYRLSDLRRFTDIEVAHLKRVNDILIEKFQQTIAQAEKLFERLKSVDLPAYYSFELTATVCPKVPDKFNLEFADDKSGSDYLAMTKILAYIAKYDSMHSCFKMTMRYCPSEVEEYIDKGSDFDDNNELWDWYDETFYDDEIKQRERFFTCHAMHDLCTHNFSYSFQDIIRIEEFESKITVEYKEI